MTKPPDRGGSERKCSYFQGFSAKLKSDEKIISLWFDIAETIAKCKLFPMAGSLEDDMLNSGKITLTRVNRRQLIFVVGKNGKAMGKKKLKWQLTPRPVVGNF